MAHFDEQNGPFCGVKWPVLKKTMDRIRILFELFTVFSLFALKKRAFFVAEFLGIFC